MNPINSYVYKVSEWDQTDRSACGIISLSVEIDICMQPVNLPSTLAMWLHLKSSIICPVVL